MIKAYEIEWDIPIEEVYEKLKNMTSIEAAKTLNCPLKEYRKMNESERNDLAYQKFHHNQKDINEFVNAPNEVTVPTEIENDEEAISDWLSDEYGWCHTGFKLTSDK